MPYSIGEVSKKLNITASALRYYDKEGLIPSMERKESGIRLFTDLDLQWINIINCLKTTGMPIKDIKVFIDWCMQGDATLQERYEMFVERKKIVEEQMSILQKTLDTIYYKCWYYKTALEAGSEKVHKRIEPENNPEMVLEENK